MAEYLLVQLYGPMASWGEIAVGESRHSAIQPSRSALLGLLGAALGIERADGAAQAALVRGYRFGVSLECSGSPLRDFHTIDVGHVPRKGRFRSRRQELLAGKPTTMLSSREYRCDSVARVAIEALPGAPVALADLAEALRRPHFSLYLGRKSCPLAVPLLPQCVSAETLRASFDQARFPSLLAMSERDPDQMWPGRTDRRYFRCRGKRYYWEDGMQSGMPHSFEHVRRDQPLSRSRWQFEPRREWVYLEDDGETP